MVKFKKPDWKCVFTYVQSFYRRFRDGRSPPPKPTATSASSTGQAPLSEVALACIASQEAENRGKEIAKQLQPKAAAPIDASHQIVKRQTEETKTAEDVKTKVEEGQTTTKEEQRKKKNKARPAPLKNLALIRHEDDVQSSGSQPRPSQVGNEEKRKENEDVVDDKEKDDEEEAREEDKRKSSRPKMPSQPPPPVSL